MKVDIVRIDNGKGKAITDIVTDEIALTINLDGKELLTLLCSPDSLKELSIGFLYSAGLIKSASEVENITIDTQNWISHVDLKNKLQNPELIFKRMYTSGCGRGAIFYNALDRIHKKKLDCDLRVDSAKIIELMSVFDKTSVAYRETGGVHSAALSDAKKVLVFKEDIGRHNALDKAIGEALIRDLNLQEFIVLTSGRVSSEIVLKVEKMRSPILVSRSAPTDQAVRLARELNLTLIGFVRGLRMNVYAAGERLI